jgi:hypothetical protein
MMTDFVLLDQHVKMCNLSLGMTVQGSEGGTSVILGKSERLVRHEGVMLWAVATEHGVLVQQHNALVNVNVEGP